jgi:hypothetical protein
MALSYLLRLRHHPHLLLLRVAKLPIHRPPRIHPPDPGTDPDDDDDDPAPPQACKPPRKKHGNKGGKPWSHRRPNCCRWKDDDARTSRARCDRERRITAIRRKRA